LTKRLPAGGAAGVDPRPASPVPARPAAPRAAPPRSPPPRLAGGRPRLEDFLPLVEEADRPALLREGTTLIRRLWTEPSVTYRGEHFEADGVALRPQPIQKPPPIWVAAKRRKAVELAAEVGDGFSWPRH